MAILGAASMGERARYDRTGPSASAMEGGFFLDQIRPWWTKLMGSPEMDQRYASVPRYPTLRHYRSGLESITQWTGNEARAIAKSFLGVVAGDTPEMGVEAARAVLDFTFRARQPQLDEDDLAQLDHDVREFHEVREIFKTRGAYNGKDFNSFAKMHMMGHYTHQIREWGAPDGYSTEGPERLHIEYVKIPYDASSGVEPEGQMTRYLQQLESLCIRRAELERAGVIEARKRCYRPDDDMSDAETAEDDCDSLGSDSEDELEAVPATRVADQDQLQGLLEVRPRESSNPGLEPITPYLVMPYDLHPTSYLNLHITPDSGGAKKDAYIETVKDEITQSSKNPNVINCFSDGHMSEGKVGVGYVIYHLRSEVITSSKNIGSKTNIYDAEMTGIASVAKHAVAFATESKVDIITIYCDNQAAVKSIASKERHPCQYASIAFLDAIIPFLEKHPNRQVHVKWAPGHKGIPGNERADQLAKAGANVTPTPQFERTVTWSKTTATNEAINSWSHIWDEHTEKRPDSDRMIPRPPSLKLHPIFNKVRMPRERSSRLIQLLTGHGFYGEYRAKRFIDQDTSCTCGETIQTIIHVLFFCPSTAEHRHILTECSAQLIEKVLFGTVEGLEAVSKFIAASGIGTLRRSAGSRSNSVDP